MFLSGFFDVDNIIRAAVDDECKIESVVAKVVRHVKEDCCHGDLYRRRHGDSTDDDEE